MEKRKMAKMGGFMMISSIIFFVAGYYINIKVDGITHMIPYGIGAILFLLGGELLLKNLFSKNDEVLKQPSINNNIDTSPQVM